VFNRFQNRLWLISANGGVVSMYDLVNKKKKATFQLSNYPSPVTAIASSQGHLIAIGQEVQAIMEFNVVR
jgi:hypothetical protein